MSQSPELAGGEGFTYEGYVAAFYLSALLAQKYAPGIEDRTVVQVSSQQRDFGEALDDVIVDFECSSGNSARLSLQVKRALTISAAVSNKDFRDIIRDSWETFKKPDFNPSSDRYGAAVGTISAAKERTLNTLCEWARESTNTDHFEARFINNGVGSKEIIAVKRDIISLLEENNNEVFSSEDIHQFLAHFVLIRFDFITEAAVDPSVAINTIRDCLTPQDSLKASLVWSKLVQLARDSAGKAGQFDRSRLVNKILPVAQLIGAVGFRQDLDRLTELTKSYAKIIQDDIGGEKLERTHIFQEVDSKLESARVIQIRGLPGSGKSVFIKRAAQRALKNGPVIFLKAEQLEGNSWNSYAISQGLSIVSLESLLVELGAVGTPILFIDAIDRIDKDKQAIIIDLFQTIVESPLLKNWRIVTSLRDTGIEVLRNWLGEYLNNLTVETVEVGLFNDEEAEALSNAKPGLRPLLFGASQVREIVRRPFFAKVLNQSHTTNNDTQSFVPQSEIDLIENWWQRGGYDEAGQDVVERQRSLIELASVRARNLSKPINLRGLPTVSHINNLIIDGILLDERKGISVNFSHDIFFEWAFYHVLAGLESQWFEEVRACGEPPAVARVVELMSQWEYVNGEEWESNIANLEGPNLRSQWLRSWLLSPLYTAGFDINDSLFKTTVFSNNFRLFKKTLVWFQAEKTSPNTFISTDTLSQEESFRMAYLLGWPSDFSAWRQLITFILRYIDEVPQELYPEVIAIFEVWQNAFSDYKNPTSHALLLQCSTWLTSIGNSSNAAPKESDYFKKVPNLNNFRVSLYQLLLKASKSETVLANNFLMTIINSEHIEDDDYRGIIVFSRILAETLPEQLLKLSVAYLCEELPRDKFIRENQENEKRSVRRETILSKPETERTDSEKVILSQHYHYGMSQFNRHDWDRLSISDNSRSFYPPSPLREPFHSLFKSSPDHALKLVRALCNHAITAWRQLHDYSRDREKTPVSLELKFPWGDQEFWGTDREYLWFRSVWAPNVIGCGFMALEEWCFSELENERPVAELIEKITEGSDCIAVLGIAAELALHTRSISKATLPLVTSQRLLEADHNRMRQDLQSMINLMGFRGENDKAHIHAIQRSNEKSVRKAQLENLIPDFIFSEGATSKLASDAILNFSNNLPFQYEEHRDIPDAQEYLKNQALRFSELADTKNYQAYKLEGDTEKVAIAHISPSASESKNITKRVEAIAHLESSALWLWASNSFEEGTLDERYSIKDALSWASNSDTDDLFKLQADEVENVPLRMRRGAVAGIAAIALNFRENLSQENLIWARNIVKQASNLPESIGTMWCSSSISPWHQAIYAAKGLAADIRESSDSSEAFSDLLRLVAHPLECVANAATEEACKLWSKDPRLTWSALILSLSLCHIPPRPRDQFGGTRDTLHTADESQKMIDMALAFYKSDEEWQPLPLPPLAWVRANIVGEHAAEDHWVEPDIYWHSGNAAKVVKYIPFDAVLKSSAKAEFLDFLSGITEWTNLKNNPPWAKTGDRNSSSSNIYEWTSCLGSTLGKVVGLLSISECKERFIQPILDLEGDTCWELLEPFTDTYTRAYIYDSNTVPEDAMDVLMLCLDRFLQAQVFKRNSYRSGEFTGFHQPELIRILMFVSVEHASLASRYANGDWAEVDRIVPLVDKFIRNGGWASSIMSPFLTLCERSISFYPADTFADQILITIENEQLGSEWNRTLIPARVAGIVQILARREAPMQLVLAQKFLRILDVLVDMGDRRSAALQHGEAFRSIRLPAKKA